MSDETTAIVPPGDNASRRPLPDGSSEGDPDMRDTAINVKVDPGNHDCEPPNGGYLADAGANTARWRCPVCKSRWLWKSGPGGWSWERRSSSSRRWSKAERRRVEQRLTSDENGRTGL